MKIKRFSFEKLFRIIREKLFKGDEILSDEQKTIDDFHKLIYNRGGMDTNWMGIEMGKYPNDLLIYQEIIYSTKPDVIVECGTDKGGSALFFAHIFDIIGKGEVITIDIDDKNPPQHKRIKYLVGKSTSNEIFQQVKEAVQGKRVLVVLDSDHDKGNVLKELNLYHGLVSEGCYLVVEDSNINGHPVHKNFGAGPMEAITEFLKGHDEFEIDKNCERFLITTNPNGYLRRKGKCL